MTEYKASTIWATMMMAIIVILCIAGGYWERGYIAFDASFIILLLSTVIIRCWYVAEKNEYYRRKNNE